MKKLRTLAVIIAGLWCCSTMRAYDFSVSGIYYNILSESDLTVEVTYSRGSSGFSIYNGNITIPKEVTYEGITYKVIQIGAHAFNNTQTDSEYRITGISLPNSITTIKYSAFANCTKLTSIEIPESVTTIGMNAFSDCSQLVSVYIPTNVTSIGSYSFYNCTALTSITIPSKITTIEEYTFKNCTKLSSVELKGEVTAIEQEAFYGCTSLTSISIPGSVTKIGSAVFYGCSNLESVIFEDGEELLEFDYDFGRDPYTFYGCNNFTYLYLGRNLPLKTGATTNPSLWCTSPFARKYITSVVIGETVTSIADYLFYGCNEITTITAKPTTPPTVASSYSFAFNKTNCTLNVPKGCYMSYKSASYFSEFKIPLTDFSVDGFYYNVLSEEDMTVEVTFQGEKYNSYADEYTGDIVIPQTVTYADKTFTVTAIGEYAFCGCENITSIQLPSTIKEIKEYGVNYCTKLTSINLPEGLTTIGPRAFRICTSLTSLEIPSSVTSIGEDAFYDDGNLVSITFKGAINSIGNGAFSSCEKLTEIHVEDIADWCQMGFASESSHPLTANLLYDNYGSITGSKGALYINGEKITHLVIPDNVEKINDYVFYVCEDFTSVDLGKGVKSIGNYAFAYCTGLDYPCKCDIYWQQCP